MIESLLKVGYSSLPDKKETRDHDSTANYKQSKALITGIMDELSRGNGKPFVDAMADEFVWTLRSRSALLKAHRTRERAEPAKTRAALKLVEQKIDYYDTWLTTGERPADVPRLGGERWLGAE